MSGPPGMAIAPPTWLFGFAICSIFLMLGIVIFGAGISYGTISEMERQRTECVKRETRLYADTRWFGTGLIAPREVCVQWIIRR